MTTTTAPTTTAYATRPATPERRAQQRRRRIMGLAAAAGATTAVVVGIAPSAPAIAATATDAGWWSTTAAATAQTWAHTVANPWYWLAVAVLVVAERLWPARDGEGTLTTGGAQDLVWTLLAPVVTLTVVALAAGALNTAYDHLIGTSLDLTPAIGTVGVAVAAFLLADFGMWFTHWARHKVPTFWHFHAVHHAPTAMNPMVDNRVHFVEPIVSTAIVIVPARILGLEGPAALALALATTYFTALIHANLRTNFGPLRYLLVSPQAHRVHHSYAPEHIDTNFGTVLSVWDRIFGTYYRGEDEYPTVGIPDAEFPLETSAQPVELLAGFVRQTVYPFRQCVQDIGRYRDR